MPKRPCPIPRCALEWGLALQTGLLGLTIGALPESSTVIQTLTINHMTGACRALWVGSLIAAASFQTISLVARPMALQRWAAFFACFVTSVFALFLWGGPMYTEMSGVATLTCVGELFVFAMLRGAGWHDVGPN